jgi:hypothetical protein
MKGTVSKTKKKKIDLTKVSDKNLEKEMNRRGKIRRQKEADKTMQEIYKLYQTRSNCPLLGGAYLPDGFSISRWYGLETLKTFEIASIRFGDHRGNKHSGIDMKVSKPTYEAIRSIVNDWDKLIKEFWAETYERFNKLVTGLIKDPARIAIMIAETGDNFNINSETSSEVEIEYYNMIIKLFNNAVVKRFEEYSDDVLVDALRRIEKGEARPGFAGNREDSADMLMAVLNQRGHSYTLNREKWENEERDEEGEDDIDDEDEDEVW